MPLTEFQAGLARLLSSSRSPDSYLAGGAAIHLAPNTKRFSNDLDYFHDSPERVASAFTQDREMLVAAGYDVDVSMSQPGFIRAIVGKDGHKTKVEWAHDSAWRFMPTVRNPEVGYQLHPVDLAVNKLLALAGRDEPRDLLDTIELHRNVLPLGALCWAAAGKDPGFTPRSLLELLRRRGTHRREDFARLSLTAPVDLVALREEWRSALDVADSFVSSRTPDEVGCLYYSPRQNRFVQPQGGPDDDAVPHYGRPGGVLPAVVPSDCVTRE